MSLVDFIKDRDEALLSLDKEKILAYCRKYGIAMPKDELAFWAGVHKSILHINSATDEQKQRSCEWLTNHGFSTDL